MLSVYYPVKRAGDSWIFFLLEERKRILKEQKEILGKQVTNSALYTNNAMLDRWWETYVRVSDRLSIDEIRSADGNKIDSLGKYHFEEITDFVDTTINAVGLFSYKEIMRMKKEYGILK